MIPRKIVVNPVAAMVFLTALVLQGEHCRLQASVPNMVKYYTDALHRYDYQTDTIEQIMPATKSGSYFVRYAALYVLTDRMRDEAIPVLKVALDDKYVRVRKHAAHLLGTLGDKSGIEQMHRDLATFAPNNGASEPDDPNLAPSLQEQMPRRRQHNLILALEVAEVLAELGDHSGYPLAEAMGFEGPLNGHRALAVSILKKLAQADQSVLEAEDIHPHLVLCAMAHSEKTEYVFKKIVIAALVLGDERGHEIAAAAKENPHRSEEELRRVAPFFNALQRKKKR